MKTKGISIWEQHLERIVLGVAVLVFVGLTALQFVGNPNATQVNGQEVSPGEIDDMVKTKAEGLLRKLTPEAAPAMQFDDPDPILDEFESRRVASISPVESLGQFQHAVVLGTDFGGVSVDKPFNVPTIPAPYGVTSRQYFDAISEDAASIVEQEEDLQAMISALPHDLTWVTTAARFDVAKVLAQYKTEGADGELPIPPNWYDGRLDVLDVQVEREEYVDGKWTNLELLEPIPGQVSFRMYIDGEDDLDAATRDWVIDRMSDPATAEDVIQPEFYPLVNGSWAPPREDDAEHVVDASMTPEEMEIQDLRRQTSRLQSELGRVSKVLQDLGGELEPEPPASNRGSGGPGSNRGGGSGSGPPGGDLQGSGQGGGGTAGGARGGSGGGEERNKKRRISLTKRKRQLESRIARFQERLEALVGSQAVTDDEVVDEGPAETIMVWAHDLTVTPGTTYRYRITVAVFNPFSARRIHLVEEQHDLAESLAMSSSASEWSEPLFAERPLRVFITSATGPGEGAAGIGGLDMGAATAEVYRFHNSRWWRDDFRISPGDRIGEVKEKRSPSGETIEIDYRSDWFLLDVVSDLTADKQTRDRRWAAKALLQSLNAEDRIVARLPAAETTSRERQNLKDEVDFADQQSLALAEPS